MNNMHAPLYCLLYSLDNIVKTLYRGASIMFAYQPILKGLLTIALSTLCATAIAQEKTYSFAVVP